MPLLDGKNALITGAGRGLGAEMARHFAREGARVVVVDIDGDAAAGVAADIVAQGGTARAETLDISVRANVLAFAELYSGDLGPIDVLVNNAGICPHAKLDDPDLIEKWDRVIDVNLRGQWDMTIALLPALRKPGASVIFTASIAAFTAPRSSAAYGAAKSGIRSLIQYFARELGPDGVRVNGLAPGRMITDMTFASATAPGGDGFLDRVALRRNGEASEIGGPAVFLASSMSSYVTGVTLPVDGGFLAI